MFGEGSLGGVKVRCEDSAGLNIAGFLGADVDVKAALSRGKDSCKGGSLNVAVVGWSVVDRWR